MDESSDLKEVTISCPYDPVTLAKHMVEELLGEENEYLTNLMRKQLMGQGTVAKTTILPISEKFESLQTELDSKVKNSHSIAIKNLSSHDLNKARYREC